MTSLVLPRRKFLLGLTSIFAAPAIVRVASLMPLSALPPDEVLDAIPMRVLREEFIPKHSLLTIQMITREALRFWKNSNAFMYEIDMQYAI
jgi:hypothetical protein